MRHQRSRLVLILIPVASLAIVVLAATTWGLLSVNFWLTVVAGFILPTTLLYVYWRNKRMNEIIRCSGCGRDMIYSVFHRAGACPRCHAASYVRSGTWPKA